MALSEVCWLQQTEVDVPLDDGWLSVEEAERLAKLRFAKRRNDWRLGRWTAKRAVARYLGREQDPAALALIAIRPAPSGAPEVFLANTPAGASISLSHRDGVAMCAVAAEDVLLGCDLEAVEPHSQAFVRDYFTAEEQAFVAANPETREFIVALIWSAKESALKVQRTGLRDDTRSVSVQAQTVDATLSTDSWAELSVRIRDSVVLSGWWQRSGSLLRTLVANPQSSPPVSLA